MSARLPGVSRTTANHSGGSSRLRERWNSERVNRACCRLAMKPAYCCALRASTLARLNRPSLSAKAFSRFSRSLVISPFSPVAGLGPSWSRRAFIALTRGVRRSTSACASVTSGATSSPSLVSWAWVGRVASIPFSMSASLSDRCPTTAPRCSWVWLGCAVSARAGQTGATSATSASRRTPRRRLGRSKGLKRRNEVIGLARSLPAATVKGAQIRFCCGAVPYWPGRTKGRAPSGLDAGGRVDAGRLFLLQHVGRPRRRAPARSSLFPSGIPPGSPARFVASRIGNRTVGPARRFAEIAPGDRRCPIFRR